jgi:MFS family permease
MASPETLSTPQAPRRNRPTAEGGNLVLVTACCGVMVGFGSLFISTFGIFLKPVADEMGWSRTQMSVAFTLAVFSVAFTAPMVGRLLDRIPPRRVVIPSTIIWGLSFASLSLLTRHIAHLLTIYAVMGSVGIATTQLGYARAVSTWFDRGRGRALAVVMAGSGVGFMIFPPLAQALIGRFGWRLAYAALGTVVLATAVPLAVLFLREREGVAEIAHKQTRSRGTGALIRTFPFLGTISASLLFSFATNGLNTHWAPLLTDHGLTPAAAAKVLSIAGLATLISKLCAGYLLDRLRANVVGGLLFLCTALGLCTVGAVRAMSTSCAAAVLVGIGMGAESDVVPYLLTRYFGLEHFSELYGYTWTVYAIAGGLGPLLAGVIFDRSGDYQIAITAFAIMVFAASALLISLPKFERHV